MRAWRHDAKSALVKGELRAPSKVTLRDAADAWLEAARAGQIRNRSGDPYKPSAIRGYEKALRLRVLPRFGDVKLSDLRRIDLQDFVDAMMAEGLSASTIDTTLNPVRAIYRHAVARNEVGSNPARGLELPAVRSKPKRRLRVVQPAGPVQAGGRGMGGDGYRADHPPRLPPPSPPT